MPRQRVARVADEVRAAVADILRHLKDPRMGFASVLRVDLSSDLRYARVHVSVFGPRADEEATLEALERAKGHVRTELGRRVRLYHTPELRFVLDGSIAHGDRIARVLRELAAERDGRASGGVGPNPAAGAAAGPDSAPAGADAAAPGTASSREGR